MEEFPKNYARPSNLSTDQVMQVISNERSIINQSAYFQNQKNSSCFSRLSDDMSDEDEDFHDDEADDDDEDEDDDEPTLKQKGSKR